MTVDVIIDGYFSVKSNDQTATLIGFTGKAYGDYFQGHILPYAVDTQTTKKDGTRLSASYMLEGKDFLNQPCRVYISNVGYMASMKPQIITDSKALSYWNDLDLIAKIESSENGVVVNIYCEEEENGPI